jgi:hypothetical protein
MASGSLSLIVDPDAFPGITVETMRLIADEATPHPCRNPFLTRTSANISFRPKIGDSERFPCPKPRF